MHVCVLFSLLIIPTPVCVCVCGELRNHKIITYLKFRKMFYTYIHQHCIFSHVQDFFKKINLIHKLS